MLYFRYAPMSVFGLYISGITAAGFPYISARRASK